MPFSLAAPRACASIWSESIANLLCEIAWVTDALSVFAELKASTVSGCSEEVLAATVTTRQFPLVAGSRKTNRHASGASEPSVRELETLRSLARTSGRKRRWAILRARRTVRVVRLYAGAQPNAHPRESREQCMVLISLSFLGGSG